MSNLKTGNYDDFALKLKQKSTIETLKRYILWQRALRKCKQGEGPGLDLSIGPVSINLDVTMACNYACTHCVDSSVLNVEGKFTQNEVRQTIDVLSANGLKSVIIIGGGEPLLHSEIESMIRHIKSHGLQLAIVTNGSNNHKLMEICKLLDEKDWIRFSLDAGNDETFQEIHRPRKSVNLLDICAGAKRIKEMNPKVSLGFSYIIIYEGCMVNGKELRENIDEIPAAAELAALNGFDFITFKPCLIKSELTANHETLLLNEDADRITRIAGRIKQKLDEAISIFGSRIKINESINLRAFLGGDLSSFKLQPKNCHSQIFRSVVTPIGIYHCPAYRGDAKAFVHTKDGYLSAQKFEETVGKNFELVQNFDASVECKDIVCFYNRMNWWIEDLICSTDDLDSLEAVPDDNFFM